MVAVDNYIFAVHTFCTAVIYKNSAVAGRLLFVVMVQVKLGFDAVAFTLENRVVDFCILNLNPTLNIAVYFL